MTQYKQAANLLGARLDHVVYFYRCSQRKHNSTKHGRRATARAAAGDHLAAGLGAVALAESAHAALLQFRISYVRFHRYGVPSGALNCLVAELKLHHAKAGIMQDNTALSTSINHIFCNCCATGSKPSPRDLHCKSDQTTS